jgi:hypothetical protein
MRNKINTYLKKFCSLVLQDEIDELKKKIEYLEQENEIDYSKVTASKFVDTLLERPIEWIKWEGLPPDQRLYWSNNAQSILSNPVFQSLCGKDQDGIKTNGELVKQIIENSFRQSSNYDMIKDARMTINGIELIREKLQEMLYSKPNETHDNIYSAL